MFMILKLGIKCLKVVLYESPTSYATYENLRLKQNEN